ncbi:transcription elongation factor GreA [Williamsoniiplasma luminosum]|uniref:Transcription elongation factor GreA n=1 Tax=Williamsoniiplasma luminosum TaxID=214888 RepID=A0A2K8NUG2_9MOLU|nr:transcription elongation factor GreA [Williamsoniiplasma luminosum]ATZ17485.1 transcription elongation factor GreA [Williamsoniiplasma luminosum]
MTEKIILTKEGLEEKKQELKYLIEIVRPQVIAELVEARNQGDLSENADYDAARNRQAEIEAKINEIEAMISKVKVIDTKADRKGNVKIGSTVEFTTKGLTDVKVVKIVGAVEADPFLGTVSNESPLAKAMIGHPEGETVEVRDIQNPYKITIKSVK